MTLLHLQQIKKPVNTLQAQADYEILFTLLIFFLFSLVLRCV